MSTRYGNQIMPITAWEWFKLKLAILGAQEKSPSKWLNFSFDDESGKVVAMIWNEEVEQLLQIGASQEAQVDMYVGWANWLMAEIKEILKAIPVLEREFDLQDSLKIKIMHDYGMGSAAVYSFSGHELAEWNSIHSPLLSR